MKHGAPIDHFDARVAEDLEFEQAAQVRDQLQTLRAQKLLS